MFPHWILRAGGGLAETYPQDTPGKKVSSSFLENAARGMVEGAYFTYQRPKSKKNCVMRKTVLAIGSAATGPLVR